jgi:hypothetical protein
MTFFQAHRFLALIPGLLTVSGVNAVDPSSYFGGSNIATYLDWVHQSSYARHAWIQSSSDSALGVAIHWTTNDSHIQLAVAANATGWVGFGLAESGSMRGADVILYTAETDELVDSYVLDDLVTPMPDDCQSWTLVNSIVDAQDGFIIFEATRALNTGDSQDRVMIDDSNDFIPATRIIAAWGDSSTPSYHGVDNRAKSSVRFMGATSSEEEYALFQTIVTREAEGTLRFKLWTMRFQPSKRRMNIFVTPLLIYLRWECLWTKIALDRDGAPHRLEGGQVRSPLYCVRIDNGMGLKFGLF